jgi:V/A-type H+-transporting ATPase subunit C
MKERKDSRKPGSDTRYTYAVARIRALEARLISPGDMERLLDEETQADVLEELGEFADYVGTVSEGEREPEEILEEQLRRAYELVSEISLGSKVIKSLRLKYDFHNLKVLMKAKTLGVEPEGLSGVGFFSREELQQVIDGKPLGAGTDPFVRETILAGVKSLHEDAEPGQIETTLDRLYYEVFSKSLRVNPFLEEYARRTIDLVNLRTLWRVQLAGWTEEKLKDNLLPGGTIDPSFFVTEYATPIADLVPRVRDEAYRGMLREAVSAHQSTGNLSALDRLADDLLIAFLRRAKHYCFGLEPLVGYIAAKENEVMRLRVILYGRQRALPTDTLREVSRISYA